jgi:hypothetical protein
MRQSTHRNISPTWLEHTLGPVEAGGKGAYNHLLVDSK